MDPNCAEWESPQSAAPVGERVFLNVAKHQFIRHLAQNRNPPASHVKMCGYSILTELLQ